MKKQFILAASLATTALFFAACSTEDKQITPATTTNVQTANYAVFSSIDEYESLFTDPNTVDEKADKVASRFGTYAENARVSAWGEQDTLYPEFLQKILNDDYIVQIEKWLIKVDAKNEQVLVLDVEYKEQYQDLVNSNLSNTKIQFFSTNDDVLELLHSGMSSSNARISGLFCKGADRKRQYAYFNILPEVNVRYSVNDNGASNTAPGYFKTFADYNSYGVYFALKAGTELWCKLSNGQDVRSDEPNVIFSYIQGSFKVNCGSSQFNSRYCSDELFLARADASLYQGVRNVSEYQISACGQLKKNNTTYYEDCRNFSK